MIPYLAQGANSAMEDGATIGLILGKITSKSQLPQALQMFQTMRKARGEAVARESLKMVSMARSPKQSKIQELVTDTKKSEHFITCAMALSNKSVIRSLTNTLIPRV
jgi:2-polyprenyl-6-methoxyphenol hydroxylase-like FAD-dependent oxidoreductase